MQVCDGALGIVGFARHQQAMDRLGAVRRFGEYRVSVRYAVLHQGQPVGRLIAGQACRIAQDQLHRQAGAGQAGGPQRAEAAGAENMPGGRHQFVLRRVAHSEWGERTAIMPRHFSLGALHLY